MTEDTIDRRLFVGAGVSAAVIATGSAAAAPAIVSDIDSQTLHKSKRTPLGLYLSPVGAHRALKANPEILFVDVRDPIEIMFVGHPAGLDKIIPIRIATHEVSKSGGSYKMRSNDSFIRDFEKLLAEKGKRASDPLFVTCRSGGRSAAAVRRLISAGFANVWNLTEGFEGDRTPDGFRAVNGWRNAGLPWNYKLNQGVAW